jgi:hypothetical protein
MRFAIQLGLLAIVMLGAGALAAQPEIDVQRAGVSVSDGGTDNLGNSTGNSPFSVTYTILNTGSSTLTLETGTPITGSNPNQLNYTINPPASVTVAAGTSTTFVVDLDPLTDGAWSMNISIDSDDVDEDPYNFLLAGNAGVKKKEDDDCSTGENSGPSLVLLAGLFAALAVSVRLKLARN